MKIVNKTEGMFHDYRIYLPRKLRNKNDKTRKESAGQEELRAPSCRAPTVHLKEDRGQLVPKIFISSYLYLCCKFRSSRVTDKQ